MVFMVVFRLKRLENAIRMKIDKVKMMFTKYGIGGMLLRAGGTIAYKMVSLPYIHILRKYTVVDERKVLFMSTPSFSDNSRDLFEYLEQSDERNRLNFCWIVDSRENEQLNKYKKLKVINKFTGWHAGLSLRGLYEVATSKYIFSTHDSPIIYLGKKRDGQVIVNLWHGCGYKKTEIATQYHGNNTPWDVSLVPGALFVDIKQKAWHCTRERIIPIGYPRYDHLICDNIATEQYITKLKEEAKKIVMWMPTFRKSNRDMYAEAKIKYSFELPLLKSRLELLELNQFCKEINVRLCVKRHPSQIEYECEKENLSNIVFLNNEDFEKNNINMYSFLRYTDGLISDYSSVSVDYLLLNKPIAYTLDDYEQYRQARGFVFENILEYMPGNHLYNLDDLKRYLNELKDGEDVYKEERLRQMNVFHNPCNAYCKRIWEFVKTIK